MNPQINTDQSTESLVWLLEPDPVNPGVRYIALTDLLGYPADHAEVVAARQALMTTGPVPVILDAQLLDGYWLQPEGGYGGGYRTTLWQIIFLAALGADGRDERIQRAGEHLLSHYIAPSAAFAYGPRPIPSQALYCYNGDLIFALCRLGFGNDERVLGALDWLVKAITGDGEIRYYKSGTAGPTFACAANDKQSCAWGANKAMKALTAIPPAERSSQVQDALDVGVEFLFSRDPAVADYPYLERVSSSWFKFSFPLSYGSDVLETAEVLTAAGYGHDPRLVSALNLIKEKQDDQGRWLMEKSLNGKMWVDIEEKDKPSKWVTLRALRVLKRAGQDTLKND